MDVAILVVASLCLIAALLANLGNLGLFLFKRQVRRDLTEIRETLGEVYAMTHLPATEQVARRKEPRTMFSTPKTNHRADEGRA